MNRADFYILMSHDIIDRLYFCCRLVDKALRNKLRILLWLPNHELTRKLDDLLWSYIPDSFLPHVVEGEVSEVQVDQSPILLSSAHTPPCMGDIVINLRPEVPDWFKHFQRVAEVVTQEAQVLTTTRKNYAHYHQQGFDVCTHRIGH